MFRLLSLKLGRAKSDVLNNGARWKYSGRKSKSSPSVPFTEPNGLWALNALINQYLSLYINKATKLWMTFGTKKGHFNAHKIAPVSNLGPFFITHDYTFTRHGAINSAPNILRMVVTQFAHGSAEGERPQLGCCLKWTSFIFHLPPIIKYVWICGFLRITDTIHIAARSQMYFYLFRIMILPD